MPRRPRCTQCHGSLSPGDRLLQHAMCFVCRVLLRSALSIYHKHKRAVTEDEQRRHTGVVRQNGRR